MTAAAIRRLAGAVLCLGCLTAYRALTAAPQVAAPPELPKAARSALKQQWSGWTLANADPQATACRANDGGARVLVSADLDADGHTDYGVAVAVPEGVRLVALLFRPWGFVLHDLDALGEQAATRSIEIKPRGAQFINPRTKLPDFYPADTLAAVGCDGKTTIYLWHGLNFDRVVLAG